MGKKSKKKNRERDERELKKASIEKRDKDKAKKADKKDAKKLDKKASKKALTKKADKKATQKQAKPKIAAKPSKSMGKLKVKSPKAAEIALAGLHCPFCKNKCPLTHPKCGKGKKLRAKILKNA